MSQKTMSPSTVTQAWLDAIHNAAKIVTPERDPSSRDRGPSDEQIIASLKYLDMLVSDLDRESHQWDLPPSTLPPRFQVPNTRNDYSREHYPPPPPVHDPENRFSSFHCADDDDDDDDDDNDDGNDKSTPTFVTSLKNGNRGVHLAMRRLMIRIVTAQSELYACQARPPQWKRGAELYQTSLFKIHHALSLADSECARWLEQGEIPTPLQEDATVVEVAIQYLTSQVDLFRHKAAAQERYLEKKLQPQWQSRDDVKKRWGQERWEHNTHAKHDFARMRQADEEQLREVRAALRQLEEMDTEQAVLSSRDLQDKVSDKKKRRDNGKKKRRNSNSKETRRDNGKRPTDLSKRVSLTEYPDPTEFGWTFTGSWKNVEFFEKDGVKLDWYFTTATIKTSLDHPKKGKTQLFGSRVTPDTYLEILLNPRAHTNVRYQERKPTRQLWVPDG